MGLPRCDADPEQEGEARQKFLIVRTAIGDGERQAFHLPWRGVASPRRKSEFKPSEILPRVQQAPVNILGRHFPQYA
jgi:hypothetical protein